MSNTVPSVDSLPSNPKPRRKSKEKTEPLPASLNQNTQESQPAGFQKIFRYPEMPTNDLVWWGFSIVSTAIVAETAVVAIATAQIVAKISDAFTLWVNVTGGNL